MLPWYGNGLHLYLCLLWSAIRPQLWFVSNKKDDCDVFLALVIQLSLFNDFLEAIWAPEGGMEASVPPCIDFLLSWLALSINLRRPEWWSLWNYSVCFPLWRHVVWAKFHPWYIVERSWIFCCCRLSVFVRWIPVLSGAVVTPSGLLQQSLVLDGIGTLHSWDQLRRGWYQTEQLNLDCLTGALSFRVRGSWFRPFTTHRKQHQYLPFRRSLMSRHRRAFFGQGVGLFKQDFRIILWALFPLTPYSCQCFDRNLEGWNGDIEYVSLGARVGPNVWVTKPFAASVAAGEASYGGFESVLLAQVLLPVKWIFSICILVMFFLSFSEYFVFTKVRPNIRWLLSLIILSRNLWFYRSHQKSPPLTSQRNSQVCSV